jgi:hypothetical protein
MSKRRIAMTAMVQEFDGVRELSVEEIDLVVGGEQISCSGAVGAAGAAATVGGIVKGAKTGAAVGALFGPKGAVVGAIAGAALAGLGGAGATMAIEGAVCS